MVEDYQENYRTGFISLYRSILNHWVFENEKYLKWWLIMLFEVNHTDNKIVRYYNVYNIKRGQSCNSLRTWANLFNTSVKTVTKFFKLLENDNMISLSKIGKGKQALTLVNITNYNDYQQKKKQELPQGGIQGSIQGLPSNNNDNNDNKYSVTDFYKDWNTQRTKYTHKPSHLNRLTYEEKEMFTELCNDLKNPKKEINDALIGFFKQGTYINGMDLSLNVKHFLKSYTTYYQAYHDKNPNVWGKNQ